MSTNNNAALAARPPVAARNAANSETFGNVEHQAAFAENWAPVAGYDDIYEVSDQGNVRSLERTIHAVNTVTGYSYSQTRPTRSLTQSVGKNGVLMVELTKDKHTKTKRVARLVASAFVEGEQPNYIVTNKDGNRSNVAANNLEWKSNRKQPAVTEGNANA